jgi:hypothetical protein
MSIRNTLIITVAVAALGTAAEAGLIVSSSRETGGTYDAITFRVSGFTGADLTYVPTIANPFNAVSGIEGTFTAVGTSAVLSTPGNNSQYIARTTNAFAGTPNTSFANFDLTVAGVFSRNPAGSTTPTALTGSWFTTGDGSPTGTRIRPVDTSVGPTNDDFDQTLLATFFVTPGADVSFAGQFNSYANTGQPLSFSSVPEPTALAALGLAGGAILRRRRRA